MESIVSSVFFSVLFYVVFVIPGFALACSRNALHGEARGGNAL